MTSPTETLTALTEALHQEPRSEKDIATTLDALNAAIAAGFDSVPDSNAYIDLTCGWFDVREALSEALNARWDEINAKLAIAVFDACMNTYLSLAKQNMESDGGYSTEEADECLDWMIVLTCQHGEFDRPFYVVPSTSQAAAFLGFADIGFKHIGNKDDVKEVTKTLKYMADLASAESYTVSVEPHEH
jgi:hypothetical protein